MGFFVSIYMRVCKKMVIYLEIKTPQSRKKRKYTWQKNACISCSRNDCKYTWEKTARISCHNFETNGRPYLTCDKTPFAVLIRGIIFSLVKNIVRTADWQKLTGVQKIYDFSSEYISVCICNKHGYLLAYKL